MLIKVKLRSIGNSIGIILPADVITGFVKGDDIEVDVKIKDGIAVKTQANVITESDKRSARAFEITRDVKDSKLADDIALCDSGFNNAQELATSTVTPCNTGDGLAPDGHPDPRLEKMYKDAVLAVDPLEFKPACVTCEHMVEGENAACDGHGCFKPTSDERPLTKQTYVSSMKAELNNNAAKKDSL